MISKEALIKKIESLPPYLLEEVVEYIDFIEYKKRKGMPKIEDMTLASEKSLSKDWLKPEEDEAWGDL